MAMAAAVFLDNHNLSQDLTRGQKLVGVLPVTSDHSFSIPRLPIPRRPRIYIEKPNSRQDPFGVGIRLDK